MQAATPMLRKQSACWRTANSPSVSAQRIHAAHKPVGRGKIASGSSPAIVERWAQYRGSRQRTGYRRRPWACPAGASRRAFLTTPSRAQGAHHILADGAALLRVGENGAK
jgi:hypothetical protein